MTDCQTVNLTFLEPRISRTRVIKQECQIVLQKSLFLDISLSLIMASMRTINYGKLQFAWQLSCSHVARTQTGKHILF